MGEHNTLTRGTQLQSLHNNHPFSQATPTESGDY